ncbi:MAG TPA: stage 0 sporulation protein [Terrisporobacter glycolicus]|uniref:Stage 0 sporulation family protein n=2 Tax=Terrisporobacter TaxID=1505652 RepID=A0AAX2ZJE2_9FIRM|nr:MULTISPECIES: stage 0 sporulation family protein [Terrisporobacter]MBN9647769.1 stage 0 sporulation family protein [Terrisporobacter glycolicus]UEL49469.1 stage 0 sporulation family protein [Terrisporobacter hibernicus]UPA30562.1 stage 0 sporulation family protein [Terrisporobacter glycolicus]SFJ56334.1 Cell fate regulator YaaT, PSP1 superfamily (controls sporulation, competence, biofilm development) [Terrisporobacter glycolicus]HBI93349.1 stage 0 sporulation protein [Terrisporobacter hiber
MINIVGVRFKNAGKIYYFDPVDFAIEKDMDVVVETARGLEYGTVVVGKKEIDEESLVSPLKPIIRIATEEDNKIYKENKEKAKETFELCLQKIKEHELTMYLIDCEYTFDRNKLIFYFTAEGRIDFRELVKDLAAIFKTRIELRQIGVRDEAKSIGGLGPCGRSLCCSSWLGDFQPVSIKMAKDQSLSLNPTKISGICGRLFCCLKYEHDVYVEAIEKVPPVGSIVKVDGNKGKVIETNPLLEQAKVEFNDKTIRICMKEEIKVLQAPKKCDGCGKGKDLDIDMATLKELKKLED